MKEETEFILQVNPGNSFIEQVMYSKEAINAVALLNRPLLFCLAPESLEAGKRFFDDIRLIGKAENFPLSIVVDDQKHVFSFSGMQLRNHVVIVAQLTEQVAFEETTLITEDLLAQEVEASLESAEKEEAEETEEMDGDNREVTVWELLEEMSRLNNELINTKRELVRKNIELERLQQQLKKG